MAKKQFKLVVNPYGGTKKGLGILGQIKPVFESADMELEIYETEYAGHAREIINTTYLSDCDGFISIGGDGTAHEVVNGLLTREDGMKVPIGVIPGGTGNSFMHDLDCLDPVEAAKKIVGGNTQEIDVMDLRMNGDQLYSFHMVGWGMVNDITITSEKIRWMGESRYTVSTLYHVVKLRARSANLIIDDDENVGEFVFVIACNTKYIGGNMLMAPKADINDGIIDLLVVREPKRFQVLKIFPKVFNGTHIDSPIVEYYRVKKFSIIPDENECLNIDGELAGMTPLSAELIKSAFSIFI
mgnify:CR=1 FL=1|tara:strand:- start:40915 stop:41808 length:894 start_codon:yes stop_codon:yes gene_type:complete